MATTNEITLQKLYELNNLYQSKKTKKKKHKKKEPILPQSTLNNIEECQKLDIEIQYVSNKVEIDPADPNFAYFSDIFEKFRITDPSFVEPSKSAVDDIIKKYKPLLPVLPEIEDEEQPTPISKKKLKQQLRISIASLKQRVQRPEVVEVHDANSKEPVLLIHLKSYRNSVPVPKHWSYKRKYLQGKRGFVKPPFELPDYIKATGIMELRSAFHEREDSRNLKAKMRTKIRPKIGKGEIDYQKLHDAFFKYQTKPRMTMHGDLYYEGKEFEVKLKQKKPGDISDDLRISLGMPVGVNKYLVPPPWLIAMQRYGPPPSYPNLKIQGLNAPIPEGATFGYHAGGWGKPPVDELGRPLYGDVFGTNLPPDDVYADELEIDKSLWGELEYEPDNATESDEEMEDVATLNDTTSTVGTITPYLDGLITPSITTVALSDKIDVETLQHLELRKRKADPKEDTRLYSVIPTKKSEQSQNVVGTSHTYDMQNKVDLNLQDEIEEVEMELDVEPPTMPESPESIKKTATSEKHQRVSKSKKKDESKSKKNKEFKF